MKETEILSRLRAISVADWKTVLAKCYSHVELRLRNKTIFGAHCAQRLGMPAQDYYVGNAIKAIYEQSREWQYEKYDIVEQLVRFINSMISNEVRKYRSEQKQNKQIPLLIENDTFDGLIDEELEDDPEETNYFERCTEALTKACDGNETYKKFVDLKLQGKNYEEICDEIGCSRTQAYQIMENIARTARRTLKAENTI